MNQWISDDSYQSVDPKDWMRDKEMKCCSSIEELASFVDEAIESGTCAVDLETTGLDTRIDPENGRAVDDIVGYCLSYDGELGMYVPVRHQNPQSINQDFEQESSSHPHNLNYARVANEIRRLCEECTTIYHNALFDTEMLYGSAVDIDINAPDQFEDTYILAYLKDSTGRELGFQRGLKHLSKKFLDKEMIELEELFGDHEEDLNFARLDPTDDETVWYAASDAICTYLLYERFKRYGGGEQHTIYQLEKACVAAQRWMERNRPKIDPDYLVRLIREMRAKKEKTVDSIYEEVTRILHDLSQTHVQIGGDDNGMKLPTDISKHQLKESFDIKSSQQLGQLLETLLGREDGVELKRTEKSGQVKTSEEVIEELSEEHGEDYPFLEKIHTFRRLRKVQSTYAEPLLVNTDLAQSDLRQKHAVNESDFLEQLNQTYCHVQEALQNHLESDETVELHTGPDVHGDVPSLSSTMDLETLRRTFDYKNVEHLCALVQTLLHVEDLEVDPYDRTGDPRPIENVTRSLAQVYADMLPFLGDMRTLHRMRSVSRGGDGSSDYFHDNTTRFKFQPYGTDSGRYSAAKGSTDHGYSGVNIQSAPGCYNWAEFRTKKINDLPIFDGNATNVPDPESDPDLYEGFERARDEQEFIKHVQHEHFIQRNRTGKMHCIRDGCEGCPLQDVCDHDEPETRRFLSLEAAIRPGIVSRDDYVFAAVDFSSLEVRVAAEVTGESEWIEEFTEGEGDAHKKTAQLIYGDDVVELPEAEYKMKRNRAKGSNFAILYGGGGSAIADSAGVSDEEGWEILRKTMQGLSDYKQWKEDTIHRARRQGYIKTEMGRKIPLHDINSEEKYIRKAQERKAINSVIQGSATGDLIKYCMVSMYQRAQQDDLMDDIRMVFSIHDELVFEVRKDTLDESIPIIREEMTKLSDQMGWEVPIEVDVELGEVWDTPWDWDKMHTIKDDMRLAKKPVPPSLEDHIELEAGMWKETPEGHRVYDGDRWITPDARQDWGECMTIDEERWIAQAPVRSDWIDEISFEAGMWWKDSDAQKAYIYDGETFQSDYDTYRDRVDPDDLGLDREAMDGRDSDPGTEEVDPPPERDSSPLDTANTTMTPSNEDVDATYTYHTCTSLHEDNAKYYLIRLQSVIRFVQAFAREHDLRLSHELRIKTPDGRRVLPEGASHRIHPMLFEALADFTGL